MSPNNTTKARSGLGKKNTWLNQGWLGKEYSLTGSIRSGCDMKEYSVSQEWLGAKNT